MTDNPFSHGACVRRAATAPPKGEPIRKCYCMCLAVPLKLIEINGMDAVGEAMGMQRKLRLDFIDEPKLGDYVIVHAGFAIERLPEEQALEDLETWEELDDALR